MTAHPSGTIHIVCRHNQARSIIGAAAIRKFFPEITVVSSGVEANPENPIPKSALEIAHMWDLEVIEEQSTPFLDIHESIKDSDLVLAADAYVAEKIRSFNPKLDVKEFKDFVQRPELVAVDPVVMDIDGISQELTKSVISSLAAARYLLGIASNIYTFLPMNESNLELFRPQLLQICVAQNIVLIDTSLRVSTLESWQKLSTNFQVYDERSTLPVIEAGAQGAVFVPKYEGLTPERTLASLAWRDWLHQLSQSRPVILLAPALINGSNRTNQVNQAIEMKSDSLWSIVHSLTTFDHPGDVKF